MSEQFGLVTAQRCCLYQEPGRDGRNNGSEMEDELFSGWAVRLLPGTEENGWVKVETHYGYQGYAARECFAEIGRPELEERQEKELFWSIASPEADLLSEPRVQGTFLELLLKNAVVERLKEEEEGWCRIRSAAGLEGYVPRACLRRRADDDRYLLEGTDRSYFRNVPVPSEGRFREGVAKSARAYLGTQYRWGGKSSQGIDCSGLAFMSYLENGVLIYRDARIREEYPIREIPARQLAKGDLIFFPGHVALYLGGGRYIHATGYAETPRVTVNSLNPQDDDYRADLAGKITAYGSIFPRHEGREFWDRVAGTLGTLPGTVSFFFRNLATGEQFGCREDEPQLAASVIKLFLMGAVFREMEDGRTEAGTKLLVRREDCVPSCGVLTYLQGERYVTVRDLIELMIIVSDNTAANLLFDLVGEERLSRFIREELGMERTRFRRKMFDAKSAARGIENYVTARDAGELLARIYRGELVSREASAEMYRILTHQRLNGKIPFRLHTLAQPPVIAHKTGEDAGITHDVALIEGKEPLVLCFLGSGTDVPALERAMADLSYEIYRRANGSRIL